MKIKKCRYTKPNPKMSKVATKKVVKTKKADVVKEVETVPEPTPEVQMCTIGEETQLQVLTIKERFESLIERKKADRQRLQDEIQELRQLCKDHILEVKTASKKKQKKRENAEPRQPSGFAKPQKLDSRLYDFLEDLGVKRGEEVARTRVTTLIHDYIKQNNLKNPEFKQEFFPDNKLKKLLGEPLQWKDAKDHTKGKMYGTMGVQVYMKPYFPKAAEVKK